MADPMVLIRSLSRKQKCCLGAGVLLLLVIILSIASGDDSPTPPSPTPTPVPTATSTPEPATPTPTPSGMSTLGNLACTSFDILIDEVESGLIWGSPVTDEEFIERLRDDVLWAVEGTDEPLLPLVQELVAAAEAGDLDRISAASEAVHEECGLAWSG